MKSKMAAAAIFKFCVNGHNLAAIASELKETIEDGTIGLPAPDLLPPDDRPMPYLFIGDYAFALKPGMMKPFSRRYLTREKRGR